MKTLHETILTVLDENGWTFLKPLQDDGTLGQQIDSTDIADAILLAWRERSGDDDE